LRRFNVEQLYEQYQTSKEETKVKDKTNTDGKVEEEEAGFRVDEGPTPSVDSATAGKKLKNVSRQALCGE